MNDTEKNLVDLIEELNKAQKHKILPDIHYKKEAEATLIISVIMFAIIIFLIFT